MIVIHEYIFHKNFSFSHFFAFTNVSLTLPKSIPITFFLIYDKAAIFLPPCPSFLYFLPIYRQRTHAVRTRKLKPRFLSTAIIDFAKDSDWDQLINMSNRQSLHPMTRILS
jgi:hypothetical protein